MKKKSLLLALTVFTSAVALTAVGCGHEHEWTTKSDADYHWQECSADGEQKDKVAHTDENEDDKCDVCGASVHLHHTYAWVSDDDGHKEVCECGDTKNEGAHVDVKNNETNAEGVDGKCDDCGYAINYTVTFDMNDYGADMKPASQTVKFGEKATEPDALGETVGIVFGGWYADKDCNTVFDFTAGITANTTVYAKWAPDATTAGYTKENPKPVEENGELTLPFGLSDKLYFSFSSSTLKRYDVSMLARPASLACSYATDKDEDGYTVKIDGTTYFDLNGTVIVTVTRGETTTDTDKVGIYLNETTNEPVPSSWQSGDYEYKSLALTVDTAKSEVIYDGSTVKYSYLGGSFNKASFSIDENSYTFKKAADEDAYVITLDFWANRTKHVIDCTLVPVVMPNPVPVATFGGVYKGTFTNIFSHKITEVGIYDDGTGYIVRNNTKYKYGPNQPGQSAVYDKTHNAIRFNQVIITLAYGEDGTVSGIFVDDNEDLTAHATLFDRTGDLGMPFSLPLENDDQYIGTNYAITLSMGSYYIKKWTTQYGGYWESLGAIDVDESLTVDGGYIAFVENNKYGLKISNDNKVIEIYNVNTNPVKDDEGNPVLDDDEKPTYTYEIGETLIDTLNKLVFVFHDLPAPGEITLTTSDFVKDLDDNSYYFYKVVTGGWYAFTSDDYSAVLVYNLTESNPTDWDAPEKELSDTPFPVNLVAGSVIRIKTYEECTFKFEPCEAPKGGTQDTAYEITGAGTLDIGDIVVSTYVKFTPARAGEYTVKVTHTTGWSPVYGINYTVNGEFVGYNSDTWSFVGITADKPEYPIVVATAGEVVWILINAESGKEGIELTITETNPPVQTEMFTSAQAGEYKGNGSFLGQAAEVTLSFNTYGKGTFAWLVNEVNISITEDNGTYSFEYDGFAASFTFNANGTINLNTENLGNNITCAVGGASVDPSPEKPVIAVGTYKGSDSELGAYTVNVKANDKLALKLVVDGEEDIIESGELTLVGNEWIFSFGNGYITFTFTVNADGSITIEDMGTEITLVKSADEVIEVPAPPLNDGTYVGSIGDDIAVTLVINGTTATYTYNNGENHTFANLTVTEQDGGYTFTYVEEGSDTVCTIKVVTGGLEFTDDYNGNGTLSYQPTGSVE